MKLFSSFAVICMGSGLQIMRGARRCWRFSRKLLKEPNMLILVHLIAPQPISLRYVFIKQQIILFLALILAAPHHGYQYIFIHDNYLIVFLCVLIQVSECVKRDQIAVFLPTKLSQPQQHQLAKLEDLLGGKMADTFSGSGSVTCILQQDHRLTSQLPSHIEQFLAPKKSDRQTKRGLQKYILSSLT